MSYHLSQQAADEVSLTGTLTGGKTWAHVFHGVLTIDGAFATSQNLLTKIANFWQSGGPTAPADLISSAVTLTKLECRQIIGAKSRVGRMAQFSGTVVGGVITAAAIADAGSGYPVSSSFTVPMLDTLGNPGVGGVLLATVGPLGTVTGVAVSSGGSGYVNPYAENIAPDLLTGEGEFDKVFGASDFFIPTPIPGTVATDVQPFFNAFSIRLRSALPGRMGRGSAHWPGVPEASTLSQLLTNPVQTAVSATANNLYVVPTTPTGGALERWQPGVFSPTSFFKYPPSQYASLPTAVKGSANGQFQSAISSAQCNSGVGSMLRRKIKI